MPPESSSLRILAATIEEDQQALRRMDAALEKFSAALPGAAWDDANVWATAGALHSLYNALENTFVRVSETFGNKVIRADRWHAELLHLMFLAVPDHQPALLPTTLRTPLKELLSFRHLYRHGYDLELDVLKLQSLVERWIAHRALVYSSLDNFRTELLQIAAHS